MSKLKKTMRIFGFYVLVAVLFLLGTMLGDRTVTAISQHAPVMRYHTVVIDPGHGGEDGGAVSCTGKRESDYNLAIALTVNDLMHLLGIDTVMTRQTDVSLTVSGQTVLQRKASDLQERVRIASQVPNAVFLSIHQNHFTDPRYYGAQVFYAENEGSEKLAELLQNQIRQTLNPGSHRQAQKAQGIYVLEKLTGAGVLVECGFLSNPTEEAKLGTREYQQQTGIVVTCAVASYLAST